MTSQRGGFVLGLVIGLLVGLALALGVALYITKAPVPFVDKVQHRTAEQDTAETEKNKNWDPNALLGGKGTSRPAAAAAPAPVAVASAPAAPTPPPAASAATARPARDPAAILAGAVPPSPADGSVYFVQAGAYTRTDEAEQQRAKLAIIGYTARITEREQSGRTVYRVRVGPYDTREEAEGTQARLTEASIEARLVRVEAKP